MKLSSSAYKGMQSFLIMGVPFIWWFWMSGTIPFNFALLALITLIGVIFFLKLELITFISIHGIDSVHEHLSHMEKGEFSSDSKGMVLSGDEALEALSNLRDSLKKQRTELEKEAKDETK